MTCPTRRVLAAAALAAVLLPSPVAASSTQSDPPRIRTTDRRLRTLLIEGMRASATFRELVHRIEASDVVVYLRCEPASEGTVAGRLTFVSSAGGFRYVVIRLRDLFPATQLIAILGHELRHAVEIADTPAIVDAESLAREYLRMGRVNRWGPKTGIAFDSEAAIEAGIQVLREVESAGSD